ncbi:adaptor complexes medium subunit family domain-containing protein [Ditylenchus destructor]|nr:adaptor complexes medium subunit family domain-containing protein [Ditylenchus destructor]
MINSLFIVNVSGDIVLEKHYKSVIHRSICDYFFDVQKKVNSLEDVPPVIATPHHFLFIFYHNNLYFIAVTTTETPPLMIIEILHRIAQTFAEYFEECSDTTIKENIVIVFELLDEILDNGYPLTTELNVLQDLIKPPNFLRTLKNQVTGKTNVSEVLPTGQLSNVPWRRQGVKYTNNEAYFDVIEEIDAIIDKQGATVSAEIQGYINCCCRMSGMPDLTMTLMNPRILDDVSFHPCVRFKRWENERVLSFVPPDGNFRLISYHIGSQSAVAIPLYIRHNIVLKNGAAGRLELTVGPKQSMGKMLEDVVLEMNMPKPVQNCNVIASHGKCSFDPTTKVLQWVVGKIELGKPPTLKGTVSITAGTGDLECPPINAKFRINQLVVSGLKVNRLDMYGEQYKPFKGVKYVSKAGRFQCRTS